MEYTKNVAKPHAPGGTHVEIDSFGGVTSVSVHGVKNIVDFGVEKAILRVKGCRVVIKGAGLSISVYENRIVELFGKISGVEFV